MMIEGYGSGSIPLTSGMENIRFRVRIRNTEFIVFSGSWMSDPYHIFVCCCCWIWNPGWIKTVLRIRNFYFGSDVGSGFESWIRIRIRILDLNPDPKQANTSFSSGIETDRIRDGKKSDPGSGINIPDPQQCFFESCVLEIRRVTKFTPAQNVILILLSVIQLLVN
jgi:hypothetical protein